MPLAIIHSRANCGIEAPLVTIEVHISNGLPNLAIVGLPETAVKESKERVRSALLNTQFEFPPRRITINLAPADLPKRDGGRFDLAIALGILAASGQISNQNLAEYEFAGELALSGTLRRVPGILPFALATQAAQKKLIIPIANSQEASLVANLTILPAQHLLDICAHLTDHKTLTPLKFDSTQLTNSPELDLADVHGQQHAKRALTIAAAGQHGLLMIGPPGTGKTMLASRLPSILPTMSHEEALETAAIYSICNKPLSIKNWRQRPFRAPHHTASSVAMVGGSNPPRPGEISLAHNGVLFLDEFPEFGRKVLEVLREPLETGAVMISRAASQAIFPSKFQLVAAMNPCPCGYLGNNKKPCSCSATQIQSYHAKISGPLIDRIDLTITVPALPRGILTASHCSIPSSATIKKQVIKARNMQLSRSHKPNSQLANKEITKFCKISTKQKQMLENHMDKLGLSARAYHRILKVARTIADLATSKTIQDEHLYEALSYRAPGAIHNM